jgi:hypothetical protein
MRAGCGYDFNDTIAAGPLDGMLHTYQCPKCGLQGEYTAPLFDDLSDEEAAAPPATSA